MDQETIVSSRPDRELRKKVITHGDYSLVPFEDSRCKVALSDVECTGAIGDSAIGAESRIFSASFDGYVLIGDCDYFIDKDFELILQQMCNGEVCEATMIYRDSKGQQVKKITCRIHLINTTEEQLISDWGWQRLYESAIYHKENGVELVKEKRIVDAFRRFNKSLKMLVAVEPIDPEVLSEDTVKEMKELKVKIYNNLAHCQLHYNEYEATIKLCNQALKYDSDNIKAYYRRGLAHMGLDQVEDAWQDIQHVLQIDPNNKAALNKASVLKPKIESLNVNYTNVIKKMFV